jgi:hypothetical protein
MNKEDILAKMDAIEKTVAPADDGASNQNGGEAELPKDANGNVDYKAAYEAEKTARITDSKTAKSALIQKAKYKETLESIIGEISKDAPKTPSDGVVTKDVLEVELFKVKHPELNTDDVNTLSQLAKATGKSMTDAMEMPVFKTYIEKINNDKAIANATAINGGRSAVNAGQEDKDKAFQDLVISKFPKNMQGYFNKKK